MDNADKKLKNKEKRLYDTWKGNNKFCFNGKIYIGSEYYYGLYIFLSFDKLFILYIFYCQSKLISFF